MTMTLGEAIEANLDILQANILKQISKAQTHSELQAVKVATIGRNGVVTKALKAYARTP